MCGNQDLRAGAVRTLEQTGLSLGFLSDMILRTQLNAGDALEMNREFQSYLSHYGETQKVALEILEKIAASVPGNS